MTISTTQILISEQAEAQRDFTALMRSLLTTITALLVSAADDEGIVPFTELERVEEEAGRAALRVFVDPARGPYADESMSQPLSPYARLINRHLVSVTVGVIAGHASWLEKNTPNDVYRFLGLPYSPASRTPSPFKSNPLARFVPWYARIDTDKNGNKWMLSDRIWRSGLNTRRKIEDYLDFNIRNGTSALKMSRELEQYLLPGRSLKRTNKPYGTDASFDGMRLARTEIARAHTDALFLAAEANPYVSGIDWRLSPSHPKVDICDKLATVNMQGQRLKDPYPIAEAPRVVSDSHPQCLCANSSSVENAADTTRQLRRVMERYDRPPAIVPIDVTAFVTAMLGTEFLFEIQEALAA